MPQHEPNHLSLNNLTPEVLPAWLEGDWLEIFI